MSEIRVNKITPRSGTDVTLGDSGDTFTLGSGANIAGLTLSDNILFDTASKGIYLGVTTATASNLLDDYEEGDWTPAFTSNSGSSLYSGTSVGKYTKIGRAVTISARFTGSALSGTTTYLRLTGLPFACINVADAESALSVWTYGGFSVTGTIQARTEINQSELVLQVQNNGTGSNITNANFSGNANLDIGGVYFTS